MRVHYDVSPGKRFRLHKQFHPWGCSPLNVWARVSGQTEIYHICHISEPPEISPTLSQTGLKRLQFTLYQPRGKNTVFH